MPHVDYYFATISPFAYLAGTRLEEIADRHGASISYKPVDLMGLFGRTGGTKPAERHASRQEYRLQELRRQAAETGLPINLKPAFFPTNMAPSSYAIIAAQAEKQKGAAPGGDMGRLVHGVMRACWAEEKNIAEDDVIRACLKDAGFDPALADSGLLSGAETYAANLEEASERGVFGSPFYIADGDERFWGQDRLDALDRHLANG
ncbi:2-hydroxychromene-2-carboxylate isomerase [Brevirhabdus pacifica]|uniref:2-hydroxychromene-2-carboxylate isomerase n=1 Tax=Brevirhabdus pacifica TaxID=1267768 RepID=A0A1U7DGZ7_9RHOB|nr:2-hydroxychromene-2-carboxylate isomerase [Brevirhabdus pacifica]APX89246.1 2-hydroxychromene-2-carboxylate isomerase [Brevirhabdus pacifica]OWU76709.1 2-hydroxychromene-2-carboxylate isomerase [Loktanella sp. 22II-4b]PJJ86147.1 2-hydroxychromene-2-carboxylate isomerase [Brevirhabdus pacifica]